MDKDKKDLTPEELSQKLDELEGKITTLTQERDIANQERDNLQKKLNALRIDGLTKQVETKEVQVEEEIQFDFDL